jgi:hypothetical protein
MPDWSIKIVPPEQPTTDEPASFAPDLIGATPGTLLETQVDDIVTWNNTTGEEHWLWPVAVTRSSWSRRLAIATIHRPTLRMFP